MKEFVKLKQLAETRERATPQEERRRRSFFDNMARHLAKVDEMVHGDSLTDMLKVGGFPATESKAFIIAWDKFQDEFDDLKKAMLIEFNP